MDQHLSPPKVDYTIHYRRYHDGSEENWRTMEGYFLRTLRPYLPADKSALIIDIGCGYGFGLSALRKAGYASVVGIDSDVGQISVATGKGLNAVHVPESSTFEFLDRHSKKASLVYAFDVLEHIPHDSQIGFLRSVANALVGNGAFVCRVPNALSPLASFGRYLDWTHQCAFCRDSLEFVFANAGLEVVDIAEAPEPSPARSLVQSLSIGILRAPVRVSARALWRLMLLSELGFRRGLREPIGLNILGVAKRGASEI